MTEFKHKAKCLEAMEEVAEAQAEYDRKWPKHCRECNGWGGFWFTFDPSPSGVSLGSGYMVDANPCEACVEKGICPRCGREIAAGPCGCAPAGGDPRWEALKKLTVPER